MDIKVPTFTAGKVRGSLLSVGTVDPMIFQFLPVSLPYFHTKIKLVLYDMVGLFFNSTSCGVTFDSRD